jgi:hypothetical protein
MEGRVLVLERQMARLRQALMALLLDTPPSPPPPPPPGRAQKGFLLSTGGGGGGGGCRAPPSSPVWPPGLPPILPDEPLVRGLASSVGAVADRDRLVFFDFETGGACRPTADTRVREVAAVAWYGGGREKAVNTFREVVTPDDGPRSWAAGAARRFNAFVGVNGVLAGFNSKRFDARVLMFEHARVVPPLGGLPLPPGVKFVDLMEVFRVLCPKVGVPRTLGAYHQALTGRAILSPHTALADAEALRACTEALIAARGEAAVFEAIEGAWETAHAVQKRCGLC